MINLATRLTNLSPARNRLVKDGAWATIGQVVAALGALVGVRVLTEMLPPEVYGAVSLLVGLMTLGCNLLASPFNSSATRFYTDAVADKKLPFLRQTILRIQKRSAMILILAIWLGGGVYSCVRDMHFIPFLALSMLTAAQVFSTMEISLLNAARRQKAWAAWYGLEAWAKPFLAVILVLLLGRTPENILFGYAVAVGSILLLFYLLPIKKEGTGQSDKRLKANLTFAADLLRYARPLIPLSLFLWITSLSPRYVLASLLGETEVGIYTATYGLISMPFMIVTGILTQTLRPAYFNSVSEGNRGMERKLFLTWIGLVILLAVFGVGAISLLSGFIAALFLGEEYRSGAVALMPFIATGVALEIIAHTFENAILANKRSDLQLLTHVIGSFACAVSVLVLTTRYGLVGTAMACPIYYSATLLAAILFSRVRRKHD